MKPPMSADHSGGERRGASPTCTPTDDLLTPADWDTQCFGFPVARLTAEAADPAAVLQALTAARQRGFRLVYGWSSPALELPENVLRPFAGALTDRKVTFRRPLTPGDAPGSVAAPTGYVAGTVPPGPASPALVQLALCAGQHSRFRVDRRFPQSAFERLYHAWIERSARGEIAAAVLTLARAGAPAALHGMVTIAIEGKTGRIGLIAVAERARGQGLGAALLQRAHRDLADRGCTEALVTTQLDNRAACRLYEAAGYQVAGRQNVYHFWPLVG
jgi:dTDP-4-amino-4,6-dideoxy-D-galactose acyltransferase